MVRKVDLGIVIALDMGLTSEAEKGRSFFEEAVNVTKLIIEKKILSKGKCMIGVLLISSTKTKNKMAVQCPGAFKRIDMLCELQEPTWQMIRSLPQKVSSHNRSDWMDAVVVAAEHLLQSPPSGVSFTRRKIILMTNFLTPTGVRESDFQQILNGLEEGNVEVDVIGPDIYADDLDDAKVARRLVESTGGATAPFEDTLKYLAFHRRKITTPMPWNIDLAIGPNIRIPVSVYKKLSDEPIVGKWLKSVKDPITEKSSASEGIVREKVHINVENQSVVEPSEVIKGYNYGQKIIPISKCDEAMLYTSGERCLSIYGFTPASKITWQNMTGDSLFYVLPKKTDNKAHTALTCLVECLSELKLVGIARRVYNNGNAPKMFALMPLIDNNGYICLSMAAICYKEEIKNMAFPPTNLKKHAVSEQQVNAFKDLIKSMDLMKAYNDYDDSEAFPIAETINPSYQYVMDCIAYRALNPGRPLPPPRDEIMTVFNVPPLIEERARHPLEKIRATFHLKEIEVKTKQRKNPSSNDVPMNVSDQPSLSVQIQAQAGDQNHMPYVQLPAVKKQEVTRIGTVNPVADYKTLISDGKTLADLSSQMTDAIESLVYCNIDGIYSKAFETMQFYRGECVKAEPCFYNDWLNIFKSALFDRKKYDVLTLIAERRLGLILKDENIASPYEIDNAEDSQMYENDTVPNTDNLNIDPDEFDDL